MELTKEVKEINQKLIDHFGIDTIGSEAIWRVSWSTDQYENRLSPCTPEGLPLLHPKVQWLPKYQHCRDRWILEQLVLIPEVNESELPSQKKSYECMWVFEDDNGNPLPPKFEACKFVVDTVYAAKGKSSMAKYVDEEASNPIEAKEKRINKLQEELFGDESGLLGRTVTGEAVVMNSGNGKVN